MIRYVKWIGIIAAVALIVSCFLPWILINPKSIIVTGIDAGKTNYGKPGYIHLILAALFILFHLIPRVWAKRANLAVAAINLAWAMRNYFMLSSCMAGICPQKQTALHVVLLSSIAILIAALFPDIKLRNEIKNQ